VIKNSDKANLDYLSGFINSWELLQHKVSRFVMSRDPLRPFVIILLFFKEMARLSPSEKAPDFYMQMRHCPLHFIPSFLLLPPKEWLNF